MKGEPRPRVGAQPVAGLSGWEELTKQQLTGVTFEKDTSGELWEGCRVLGLSREDFMVKGGGHCGKEMWRRSAKGENMLEGRREQSR